MQNKIALASSAVISVELVNQFIRDEINIFVNIFTIMHISNVLI